MHQKSEWTLRIQVSAVVLEAATDRMHAIYTGVRGPWGLSVTLADGMLGPVPLASIPALGWTGAWAGTATLT